MTSKKRRRWVTGSALLVVLLYFLFLDEYSVYGLLRLRGERQALTVELASNQQQQKELSQQIVWLESDSTYIEKVAREKFRMAREGETVYLFRTEDEN